MATTTSNPVGDNIARRLVKDDPSKNPNALHDFHTHKRGPKNVPVKVVMDERAAINESKPKDPGHRYARTQHISFEYLDQRTSNAPFGYEHYVSLPPSYNRNDADNSSKIWPLILFLHGAGESQRGPNESYASLRHGIPKIILCYDALKSSSIPNSKQTRQGDKSSQPVSAEICTMVAENFITVTPSLHMEHGYGWNTSILSALLDKIVQRYRVDLDRIHVTGFSMGGYGTWDLALASPSRFASLMPICGGGNDLRATQISHIPHWVHHGDLDDIIPLQASERMVTALKKAGANVQFSRYPDLMHDSWTAAYSNIDVYKWMINCRRTVSGDERVVPDENKVVVAGRED